MAADHDDDQVARECRTASPYRTIDPLTSWTYGTAPEGLIYEDANIVGGHAYSILGWTSAAVLRRNLDDRIRLLGAPQREALLVKPAIASLRSAALFNRDYIVLRNPWGNTESTAGALSGAISMRDVDLLAHHPAGRRRRRLRHPVRHVRAVLRRTGVAV